MGQADVDSTQDHHSRDLWALFTVQRRWRTPYHIETCMNRIGRKRAFQRYLIRVCRPRCFELDPSDQIVGSSVQSVGSFVQTARSSFPSFAAAFSCHLSALVMIFSVPCQSLLHWYGNITRCRKKRAAVNPRPAEWKYQSSSQTWQILSLALAACCCFCSLLLPLSRSLLFSEG